MEKTLTPYSSTSNVSDLPKFLSYCLVQCLGSKVNYFDMLFRVFAPLNPPTGGT